MTLPTLNLGPKLEPALLSGHPWVYRNHLPEHTLQSGDWVRLEAGRASAVGLYDEGGAIGVRLFSRDSVPDRAWLSARVREALALRELIADDTDAYRLVYGEGDGLPGIVADRYDRYVVVKTYAQSVETVLADVVGALAKELKLKGIVRRTAQGLEPLWGELPPPEVTVRENGLKFIANLYEGQKTGLFLDQRENRQTVRGMAAGKTVLNLFSYNGGFSVYALAGGATFVQSVDIAAAANRDAERNVAANGLDTDKHETVTADVFDLVKNYADAGKTFDLVVLDPPSLAKAKKSRYAALRAYGKLNALALRCVRPGGLLVSSSCTAQVSPTDFQEMLASSAREAGVFVQTIHEAGHALDHPVPLSFPEGRYLKFMVMRVLEK
ncbi:class I SAM-dependent rRNA methyltransferase [soil metagenome]